MSVFQDHFTDRRHEWKIVEDANHRVQLSIEHGWLELKNKVDGYMATSHQISGDLPPTYRVQAVVELVEGRTNQGCGISFARVDGKTWMRFIVSATGYFRIDKAVDGTIETLRNWSESSEIVRDAQSQNELSVKVGPESQEFLINGTVVDRVETALPSGNQIGLTVCGESRARLHSIALLEVAPEGNPPPDDPPAKTPEKKPEPAAAPPSADNTSGPKDSPAESKPKPAKTSGASTSADEVTSLDSVLAELDALVGMPEIKQEIRTLMNVLRVQGRRKELGRSANSLGHHMVVLGPPGTGKTTVARMLGQILHHLGILSKGHVVETDRSGLVGQYIGKTAPLVDAKVNEAKGGILFIDEAYTLRSANPSGLDYGQEAIDTLMKRMEDQREDFVVIIAGYRDKMAPFLDSNPGIRSRFNRYFEFEHYKPLELFAIFERLCVEADYTLTDEAKDKAKEHFADAYRSKNASFGNGRYSRTVLEKAIERQANRLATDPDLDEDEVTTLTEADIPDELLEGMTRVKVEEPRHDPNYL